MGSSTYLPRSHDQAFSTGTSCSYPKIVARTLKPILHQRLTLCLRVRFNWDNCASFGEKVKMGDEQRRKYVRIPVETMQSCVDRLDVRISGETAGALAEDVSFRIRQIADVRV